jgi:hypothetical protein
LLVAIIPLDWGHRPEKAGCCALLFANKKTDRGIKVLDHGELRSAKLPTLVIGGE